MEFDSFGESSAQPSGNTGGEAWGFDSFGGSPQPTAPATASAGDDFFGGPAPGNADIGEYVPPSTDGGDSWLSEDVTNTARSTPPRERPETDAFGVETPVAATPVANDFFGSPQSSSNIPVAQVQQPISPPNQYAAFNDPAESPILKQYEREHQKYLEEKAKDSQTKHAQQVEHAKKDLAKFYEERKEQTKKAREENRAKAEALKSTMKAPQNDKSAWENVVNLVDIQGLKKDAKASDVARFREILISLKHS